MVECQELTFATEDLKTFLLNNFRKIGKIARTVLKLGKTIELFQANRLLEPF